MHIHSNHSDGHPPIEEILEYAEANTNLDIIAIADHDTITGAVLAQEIAGKKSLRIQVVVAEEVTAKEGHILGLFLTEPVKPGLSATETIRQIHEQGGIAVAAHPFYRTRVKSPNMVTMDGVGLVALLREKFDCVETTNAVPTLEPKNRMARFINRSILFKNETGGSDAHILHAIGKGYTLFYGKTPEDLRRSLKKRGYTQAMRSHWNFFGLFLYALFFMPKIVEFVKSIFLKNHRRTIKALQKKQLSRYKEEKQELEEIRATTEL